MKVFEKLTDARHFTGAHRHRFDQVTGKGKGRAGRDTGSKGVGHVGDTALHASHAHDDAGPPHRRRRPPSAPTDAGG